MLVVARDGIEPPTPAFSGLLTDTAKWFRMRVKSCCSATYQLGRLRPLGTVSANADRIARDKKVIIHCKVGGRSAKAIQELQDKFGFDNLYNLKGGILSYINEVQPELTRY